MMERVGIIVGSVLLALSDDTAAGIRMVHTFFHGEWTQKMKYSSRLVMAPLEHFALGGIFVALFLWDAQMVYFLPFALWCAVVTAQRIVKQKRRASSQGDGEGGSGEGAQQPIGEGRNQGDFEDAKQCSEEALALVRAHTLNPTP